METMTQPSAAMAEGGGRTEANDPCHSIAPTGLEEEGKRLLSVHSGGTRCFVLPLATVTMSLLRKRY